MLTVTGPGDTRGQKRLGERNFTPAAGFEPASVARIPTAAVAVEMREAALPCASRVIPESSNFFGDERKGEKNKHDECSMSPTQE